MYCFLHLTNAKSINLTIVSDIPSETTQLLSSSTGTVPSSSNAQDAVCVADVNVSRVKGSVWVRVEWHSTGSAVCFLHESGISYDSELLESTEPDSICWRTRFNRFSSPMATLTSSERISFD
eukprot:GEMP01119418.1.p2 GENE.GEMP01119418.1~~GEMP01119418.1.p2  ORF type:complete len:122 (-),score=8.77 GEMP01119418.1:96-461(-)